jgi:hypothetical protein
VLGKFAGVAGAVTVAYYLCSLAFLIVARHGVMSIASDPYDWPVIVLGCSALAAVFLVAVAGNYLFGWNFTTAVVTSATVLLTLAGGVIGFIGKGWYIVPFGAEISPQLLVAIAMAFLSVLVLTAVAVAASTRLGQVMTLLACAGVLFLGYLHPFIFRGEETPALRALGWLAPNLRLFDVQDALTREKPIPLDYLSLAAGYCGLYVAGVLAAAVALFQRRELEAQTASASLPGAVGLLSWLGRTAAVLTALVAVVLVFSGRQFRSPVALALEGGTVLAAVAAYALWNCFARGLRWSYWLVLALGALVALGISACAVSDSLASATGLAGPPAVVAAVLADAILLVLLLPKTRHHFK